MNGNGGRFPASFRLSNKKAFQRVFQDPTKVGGRYFILLARKNDCGHPRLGLAISKKAVKTAVERNRVKRLARESFRLHCQSLPDMDIVLMVNRSGVVGVSNRVLLESYSELWSRLITRCVRS